MTPAVSGSRHTGILGHHTINTHRSPLAVHGQKSSFASLAFLSRVRIKVGSLDIGVASAVIRK